MKRLEYGWSSLDLSLGIIPENTKKHEKAKSQFPVTCLRFELNALKDVYYIFIMTLACLF
jgi:hypothetical protein